MVSILAGSGSRGLGTTPISGSDNERLCSAVDRLESADRRVYFQLNKTVDQLLGSASNFPGVRRDDAD